MIKYNLQALEQFETTSIFHFNFGDYYIFLTNFNITLFFHFFLFLFLFYLFFDIFLFSNRRNFHDLIEISIQFVNNILSAQVGNKGQKYLPIAYSIFIFILLANLMGLMPFTFCITSQIFLTFALSFCSFIAFVILSFKEQGLNFFMFFVPKNVPVILLPFLICIEVISYISRVFSLSIRLFANMVAGHALLHIISASVIVIIKKLAGFSLLALVLAFFPLFILLCIMLLELGVAFLQAYVFTVLFTIYLNDCFGSSH